MSSSLLGPEIQPIAKKQLIQWINELTHSPNLTPPICVLIGPPSSGKKHLMRQVVDELAMIKSPFLITLNFLTDKKALTTIHTRKSERDVNDNVQDDESHHDTDRHMKEQESLPYKQTTKSRRDKSKSIHEYLRCNLSKHITKLHEFPGMITSSVEIRQDGTHLPLHRPRKRNINNEDTDTPVKTGTPLDFTESQPKTLSQPITFNESQAKKEPVFPSITLDSKSKTFTMNKKRRIVKLSSIIATSGTLTHVNTPPVIEEKLAPITPTSSATSTASTTVTPLLVASREITLVKKTLTIYVLDQSNRVNNLLQSAFEQLCSEKFYIDSMTRLNLYPIIYIPPSHEFQTISKFQRVSPIWKDATSRNIRFVSLSTPSLDMVVSVLRYEACNQHSAEDLILPEKLDKIQKDPNHNHHGSTDNRRISLKMIALKTSLNINRAKLVLLAQIRFEQYEIQRQLSLSRNINVGMTLHDPEILLYMRPLDKFAYNYLSGINHRVRYEEFYHTVLWLLISGRMILSDSDFKNNHDGEVFLDDNSKPANFSEQVLWLKREFHNVYQAFLLQDNLIPFHMALRSMIQSCHFQLIPVVVPHSINKMTSNRKILVSRGQILPIDYEYWSEISQQTGFADESYLNLHDYNVMFFTAKFMFKNPHAYLPLHVQRLFVNDIASTNTETSKHGHSIQLRKKREDMKETKQDLGRRMFYPLSNVLDFYDNVYQSSRLRLMDDYTIMRFLNLDVALHHSIDNHPQNINYLSQSLQIISSMNCRSHDNSQIHQRVGVLIIALDEIARRQGTIFYHNECSMHCRTQKTPTEHDEDIKIFSCKTWRKQMMDHLITHKRGRNSKEDDNTMYLKTLEEWHRSCRQRDINRRSTWNRLGAFCDPMELWNRHATVTMISQYNAAASKIKFSELSAHIGTMKSSELQLAARRMITKKPPSTLFSSYSSFEIIAGTTLKPVSMSDHDSWNTKNSNNVEFNRVDGDILEKNHNMNDPVYKSTNCFNDNLDDCLSSIIL